jgi:quercetin dioxygenase-like cupin family protein
MNIETNTLEAPGCNGTRVKKLHEEEGLQILRVDVEPGGEIPVHTHDCAATMVILEGTARAIGKGDRIVKKGDVVVKTAKEPHGFSDIKEPFSFISLSTDDGIVRPDGWNMRFL